MKKRKKKWCKHIRYIYGWLLFLPMPYAYNINVPRTWDYCPVRGCGKRRPK